ncbi:MAG: MFS transporter [Pseudomonadota bacterium]
MSTTNSKTISLLGGTIEIKKEEVAAVTWSFLYFFFVLSAYYMLRSVREMLAVQGGVQNIPWLFTGTFFIMLMATPAFGWVASRFPRKTFVPWVYYFFALNILLFFVGFAYARANQLSFLWLGRGFFVWLSVFNLFVVSIFWSFMADIYDKEQGRRLFGFITAGGSTGALFGPLLTESLVVHIGFQNLLPISAFLLLLSVVCVYRLRRWVRVSYSDNENTVETNKALGGTAWAGLRLVIQKPYFRAVMIVFLCANFLGGAMYMSVAQVVGETIANIDERTQFFARLDFWTSILALLGQSLLVRNSVRKFGIGWTLAILPLMSVVGFVLVAINPIFITLVVFNVVRRGVTFGLTKPTTDMLYSVVTSEEKYKAKNFIETTVYRGSDLVATWSIRALSGIGISGVAWLCVPIGLLWTWLVLWIGKEYKRLDTS